MASDNRAFFGSPPLLWRLRGCSRWLECQCLAIPQWDVKPDASIAVIDASARASMVWVGRGVRTAPTAKNVLICLALTLVLVAFAACDRVQMPSEPEKRIQTTPNALPMSTNGGALTPSELRLDRALRRGMTWSESVAAIGARGSMGRFVGSLWSSSSVISDKYPGMAIDLNFYHGDDSVGRLSSWKLRKREPMVFYLPITKEKVSERNGN